MAALAYAGEVRFRGRLVAAAGVLLATLGAPQAASARVVLVATGLPELAFVDVRTNEVAARLALPGPSRAVAISRDGERGFAVAGSEIVAVDVNARTEVGRVALGPPEISDIELAPVGTTLYVVHGRRIAALDPVTLAVRYAIPLNGDGTRIAIDQEGQGAAVVLANGRVAMVSLSRQVLLRHVKVPGAIGVAIDAGGRTLVSARGRLRTIEPGQRRPRKRALKLPEGAGGGLALSAGRSKLIVGAAPGGASGAVVVLRQRSVRASGGWPGTGLAGMEPRLEPDLHRQRGRCEPLAREPVLARARGHRDPARRRLRAISSCSRGSRRWWEPAGRIASPARAAPTASKGSAATTCSTAAAIATASTAERATTASPAGPSATSSRAATATTSCSEAPATTGSSAAAAMTPPRAGPATTSSTASSATTRSTAATATTRSTAATATTTSRRRGSATIRS